MRLYVDGRNYLRIGRHLKVHYTNVINWVNAFANQLPDAPLLKELHSIELDEIFRFIEPKKAHLHSHSRREKNALCGGVASTLTMRSSQLSRIDQ